MLVILLLLGYRIYRMLVKAMPGNTSVDSFTADTGTGPRGGQLWRNLIGGNVYGVYRNGGVYAEITKGQLRKSMGIITTRVNKGATFASLQVGPRVKRTFKDPEKGGWFAHFIEYGYLNNGKYKGANVGFARKARMQNSAGVGHEFKRRMRSFLNKQTKAARI